MKSLRNEVIKYAKMLNSKKLSALRSGNISIRYKEGFLITPSGAKYSSLKNKDIVFVSLKGEFDEKKGVPSSEWRFHQDIYLNKMDAKAIVHAHSNYATAVSTHGKEIPAFHYMVAMAGGNNIRCAKYATYGTRELSKNIIKALNLRNACLIGNHGQIAYASNLSKAFELAEEVENLSNQYITALKMGKPKILSSKEMNKVLSKAKNYKKG
ncbi:class II aldolase/adducin family protein [Candidatus Pelagibacter sp.]|jgi:L-fuculose-phosphate aldolase|nr:class II aldolase/adducin family protein [Candidatus Pelagibacter sp.]